MEFWGAAKLLFKDHVGLPLVWHAADFMALRDFTADCLKLRSWGRKPELHQEERSHFLPENGATSIPAWVDLMKVTRLWQEPSSPESLITASFSMLMSACLPKGLYKWPQTSATAGCFLLHNRDAIRGWNEQTEPGEAISFTARKKKISIGCNKVRLKSNEWTIAKALYPVRQTLPLQRCCILWSE